VNRELKEKLTNEGIEILGNYESYAENTILHSQDLTEQGDGWVSVDKLNQKLQGELKKGNSMVSAEYVIEILNNALPAAPKGNKGEGSE